MSRLDDKKSPPPILFRLESSFRSNSYFHIFNVMSSILDPEETFASLSESVGLDIRLRKAVQRLGHVRPTLVQSKCLPLAINSGRDLLVRAKTGSGELEYM
jgi:superfamily II DNA/RNA helicase